MRVAFCIDNMNVGGTELNAVRTARHLVARGLDLRVYSLGGEGPLLGEYQQLGVAVTLLPLEGLVGRSALRAGRRLLREVRQHRIDIVHAHDFYSNVFAAPWARAAGAAFIASRRWWQGSTGARRLANRASYALADRVLANSPAVARMLREQEKVPAHRIVIVPNFLDEIAFADPPPGWLEERRRTLELPQNALVIGSVGSLSPVKDNATLLHAAARLAARVPQLHVLLAGRDAGSRTSLERLAEELRIADRVHFAGELPQQPSAHYLLDVSALTSVSEGLPNSVLEAMAAARPVVATAVGAVADAVVDAVTGFVVPPRDPDALADRLGRLLEDAGLRRRLGEAGRSRAREHYSEAVAMRELLSVYAGLTGG
jgi:glycosyltransferase involved in cell wall biosynthesis